jgi:glycosyltransferase involved in cell wall biosynthesis
MYTPSIYGGFCAKLTGIPILIASRRRLGYFKDNNPGYQLLENVVNRFTHAILVNSHAVKHEVLQRETIDPDKIHLIHNGVNIHEFKPADAGKEEEPSSLHLKKSLGIPKTSPVIGMIANFFRHKGHQEFIIAAAEVHRQYPQVRFLCMGEDWGIRRQLEHLCQDLGIHRYFTFLEGMHTNMPEFFRLLNILISASYEEGFSNVILEAMASGKPVIATSVGGTPEAVLHNITGLLIPPKDPVALAHGMMMLLNNPELATRLGYSGRKRVEEYFSMEKMLDKLQTMYLELSEL